MASSSGPDTRSLPDRRDVAERLHNECVERITLPASMYKDGDPTPSAVGAYLNKLLLESPASFLERYGSMLTVEERHRFEDLRGDYEVDYWLTSLERTTGVVDSKRLPSAVKNRRLAFMQELLDDGEFFSMESMRQRAPLLYHEYLGQYETAGFHIPSGGRLTESLLRQHDEVQHMARLQAELDREQAQYSESETSESELDDDDAGQASAGAPQYPPPPPAGYRHGQPGASQPQPGTGGRPATNETPAMLVPDADLATRESRFLEEMKTRFLTGQDDRNDVNYPDIDSNTLLDDHWLEQMGRDAEDKYFDED